MMWIQDQQKDKKKNTLGIDSDMKSENETHSAGETTLALTEEWIEDNISQKLKLYRCVRFNYWM